MGIELSHFVPSLSPRHLGSESQLQAASAASLGVLPHSGTHPSSLNLPSGGDPLFATLTPKSGVSEAVPFEVEFSGSLAALFDRLGGNHFGVKPLEMNLWSEIADLSERFISGLSAGQTIMFGSFERSGRFEQSGSLEALLNRTAGTTPGHPPETFYVRSFALDQGWSFIRDLSSELAVLVRDGVSSLLVRSGESDGFGSFSSFRGTHLALPELFGCSYGSSHRQFDAPGVRRFPYETAKDGSYAHPKRNSKDRLQVRDFAKRSGAERAGRLVRFLRALLSRRSG